MNGPKIDPSKHHLYIAFQYTDRGLELPFQTVHVVPCGSRREVQQAFDRYSKSGAFAVGNAHFLAPGNKIEVPIFGPSPNEQNPGKWYLYLHCQQRVSPMDEHAQPTRAFVECDSEHDARTKLERYSDTFARHGGQDYATMLIHPADHNTEPTVLIGQAES